MCSLQVFLMGQKGIMQVGYLFLRSTQSCGVSCASYTPFPDVFSTQLSCCWLKHFSCPYKPLNLLTKCSRSGYQTEVFSGMLLLQEDSDFLSVFSCWFPPPQPATYLAQVGRAFLSISYFPEHGDWTYFYWSLTWSWCLKFLCSYWCMSSFWVT